ncbi:MAG: sigma-70 family RNA polymerase sigma factor [Myxococcales bacterium]|jgi:RNA polymerase sigma-70 factor (ECF subfamily)|nr:sigma-70 family RNA polymerase sigma factor [Myxococcales bacterium]
MTTPAQREAATAAVLVAAAKAGEPHAFDALVRRYRKRIFALALHLSGSESDADDIVQDVFLRAYRALDQFEGRSEFFTWVYRLTVNRALDARRTRARRSESSIDLADPRIERSLEVDAPADPRRAAELRQTYARVLQALDALPAEMRTTVVLVTLQGLSNAEAAVVQGCSRGTIAWRLHEGRKRLLEATNDGGARRHPLSEHLGRLLREAGLPLGEPEPTLS